MRKLILIAGFVLASATAHGADSRSLSLAGSDSQTTAAPAKTNVPPQIAEAAEPPKAEAPRAADVPKAEAPRYVERPAIVETKPERYRDEPRYKEEPRYKDEPRYKEEPRYRDEPKYKDEPRYTDSRRPYDDGPRYDRPRSKRYWTERRIINALHRRGIYW
ncbi:MAG: hypothetical protein H0V72_27120 [Bradyrhizobium sp.]|nr:hypothetical protein [Bradyrhizobium sp.]